MEARAITNVFFAVENAMRLSPRGPGDTACVRSGLARTQADRLQRVATNPARILLRMGVFARPPDPESGVEGGPLRLGQRGGELRGAAGSRGVGAECRRSADATGHRVVQPLPVPLSV